MFNPNRVYNLATFLQALAYNFQESEGSPPNEDDPVAWSIISLQIRPRLNCVCA